MSHFMLLLLLLLTVWTSIMIGLTYATGTCPNRCQCQNGSPGTVVICHRLNFTKIPEGLPLNTREMLFNGHLIETLHAGDLPPLENLTKLMLTSCGLRAIETGAFTALRHLANLDLSLNRIHYLQPGLFSGLNFLRNLRLDYNPFTTIADDSFKGLELTQLAMENNPGLMEMSSAAFRDCSISQLLLYNCSLNSHSSVALRALTSSLQELFWESNRLPLSFDSDLFAGFTFSHLHLNQNGITDASFLQHVRVDDLSLDGNPIGTIDFSSHKGLMHTRRLSLSNTSMYYLNGSSFDGMELLDSLYLSDNHIRAFEDDLFDVFDRVSSLSLEGNPLHCNCEVVWLKSWLHDTSKVTGEVTCSTPTRMPLKDVHDDSLLCQKPSPVQLSTMSSETETFLHCSSSGDPAPEIVWFHPNMTIASRIQPNRTGFVTSTTLHVSAKDAAVDGAYTCNAFNLAGNSSKEIHLNPYAIAGEEAIKCATVFLVVCVTLTTLIATL